MLLVDVNSSKSTRFLKKNPFFLFFKGSSFKFQKNNIINTKRAFMVKKKRSTEYLITSKSSLPSVSVNTDGYSHFICGTENNLWFSKLHKNTVTFDRGEGDYLLRKDGTSFYFSPFYRFLVDWNLVNFVFYRCFDIITGNILYSAGSGAYISTSYMNSDLGFVAIRLPSGSLKKLPLLSVGLVGRSSGILQNFVFLGKFKFSHKKKSVRGIAMNPVDHPNGGRSNVKKPFMNLYNKIAKKGK